MVGDGSWRVGDNDGGDGSFRVVGVRGSGEVIGAGRGGIERNGARLVYDARVGADDGASVGGPSDGLVVDAGDIDGDGLVSAARCRDGSRIDEHAGAGGDGGGNGRSTAA